MRKRAIITTVVSSVLLILVILAGLNAIYTVSAVVPNFTTSAEAEQDARDLQSRLEQTFMNKSSVFLNLDEVQSIVDEYPCFRLDEVSKSYPDKIVLKISERKEAFAYLLENGKYALLDGDGEFLYEKETSEHRSGGENILLSGFDFAMETGKPFDYLDELVEMYGIFRNALTEVRANVRSVALVHGGDTASPQNDYFIIEMQEGLHIVITEPHKSAGKKAGGAIARYLGTGEYEGKGLTDSQLVRGTLTVVEGSTGEILLDYKP